MILRGMSSWKLIINEGLTTTKRPRGGESHIADTLYHEARHAEQHFEIARMLAGRDTTAAPKQIAAEGGIPDWVAAQAKQRAIGAMDPEAAVATAYFEEQHGSGAAHRKEVMKNVKRWMPVHAKALERREKAWSDPAATDAERRQADAELQKLKEPVTKAYLDYRALLMESDAHAVGEKVGEAYDR